MKRFGRLLLWTLFTVMLGSCDAFPRIFVPLEDAPTAVPLEPLMKSQMDGQDPLEEARYKQASHRSNALYLFLLAQQFADRGRDKEAIAAYRKLLQLDGEAAHVHLLMGQALIRTGQLKEGRAAIQKALELEPDNVEIRLIYGQLLSSQKNHSEALVVLEELAASYPDNEEVLSQLLELELDRGDTLPARRRLEKYLKQHPDSEFAHFKLGRVLREMEQVGPARHHLERALEISPTYYQAATYLAILREEANDEAGALEMYTWLAHATNSALYHRKVAAMHLKNQNFSKALESFENLARVDPADYKTRTYMTSLLIELGRVHEAGEQLSKMVGEDPKNGSFRLMLGLVLESQDRFVEALEHYEKIDVESAAYVESLKLRMKALHRLGRVAELRELVEVAVSRAEQSTDVGRSEALFEVSSLFAAEMSDPSQAHRYLDLGLSRFPSSAHLLYQKGMVFERESRTQEGLRFMEKILEKSPDHVGALNYIGYTWAEQGQRLKEAESYIRRALKIRSDDPHILDSLGWVLYKRGDYAQAYKVLDHSFRLQPDESVIAEHLADVLVKLGRLGEARVFYEKALRLRPEKPSQVDDIEVKLAAVRTSLGDQAQGDSSALEDPCLGLANRFCAGGLLKQRSRPREPAQTP